MKEFFESIAGKSRVVCPEHADVFAGIVEGASNQAIKLRSAVFGDVKTTPEVSR